MDTRFLPNNTHLENAQTFHKTDPHLKRLYAEKYIYHSPLISELPREPCIVTFGGGRQIGKTTLLKQWMEHLLKSGVSPNALCFFSGELISDNQSLYYLIQEQLAQMPSEELKYIILDEVTDIENWDKTVKYLADIGALESVELVLSGSDLVLMQDARKRFPGRRGKAEKVDFHYYPLSFAELLKLKDKLPEPGSEDIEMLYAEFREYMIHGGFLTAINDYAKNQRIQISTLNIYSDWIRGDMLKRHKKEVFLREIIGAIIKHYNKQISWNNLVKELSIDHVATVTDYVGLLESMDAVFVQSAIIEEKLTAAPKKQKKIMFCDPFIFHAMRSWLNPVKDPFEEQIKPLLESPQQYSDLIESCVTTHFRRFYATYYIKAEGEVDIAYVKDNRMWPIEVKWTNQLRPNELKQIMKYKNGNIYAKSKKYKFNKSDPSDPLTLSGVKYMLKYISYRDSEKGEWIETSLTGKALLATPLLNKGTAFTQEERIALKLLGKLPHRVETLDEQCQRVKNQYDRYTKDLNKYIFLNNLHDKNEVLYYKVISENLAQILPIIYTPGVSHAVKAFSAEFRQPRGLYLAYPDLEKMDEILENRTHENIDLIAVTDGERVLGIGDQGIGAMDIPIAKLVVYTLCGVNPYRTLPIMLDVGTDNTDLLNNSAYLGWRHPRLRGKEYDDFISRFVQIIHQKFPKSFLHWEDFGQQNARRILEKHHTEHCMFNDDMQGTGVVTLAALLSAVKLSQIPLADHRIVIFGAGIAGVGIADQLYNAMCRQGISAEDARGQFWLIDRNGLLAKDSPNIMSFQLPYAKEQGMGGQDLLSVIKMAKPTILIGCSTVGGAFTETIVKEMARHTAYPIILPLSNPTEQAEAHPSDLLKWTNNKALIATGSPFEGVSQCNNALAFPGIGLGVMAVNATALTDNMLWAATNAIATFAGEALLPSVTHIRELAQCVAVAVAKAAIQDGLAQRPAGSLEEHIQHSIWKPYYRPIKRH